jgi:hypothetical protein
MSSPNFQGVFFAHADTSPALSATRPIGLVLVARDDRSNPAPARPMFAPRLIDCVHRAVQIVGDALARADTVSRQSATIGKVFVTRREVIAQVHAIRKFSGVIAADPLAGFGVALLRVYYRLQQDRADEAAVVITIGKL